MNIAVSTIYEKAYDNDKLFDSSACKIGSNLLLPGIKLKEELEKNKINYHTIDKYKINQIDKVIFFDVPLSILTILSPKDFIKYFLYGKIKNDYFYKCVRKIDKDNILLVIQEPETVWKRSYIKKYHKYFGKVLTWNDDYVDNNKFYKYYYPQPKPQKIKEVDFNKRKLLTLIASNKTSNYKNELYSKRLEIIKYCEDNNIDFDLYGYGWDKNKRSSYCGIIDEKLETLSNYKYCICYENEKNINGYVTEKIFDCFFSKCIPIYWGASNIEKIIPSNTFIDRRRFESNSELITYLSTLDKKENSLYISNIEKYLSSKQFENTFSVNNYIKTFKHFLLGNEI